MNEQTNKHPDRSIKTISQASNKPAKQLINACIFVLLFRVSYIEFLKPFALRKQVWRHGNNMLSLLQHPQAELPVSDIVEPPQKGLHGITAKLRQTVCARPLHT